MKLTLIAVDPIGKKAEVAVACTRNGAGCSVGAVTRDDYPITQNMLALQLARLMGRNYTSIRCAAKHLGITGSQLSDLENGRATLSPEEFAWAISSVEALQGR